MAEGLECLSHSSWVVGLVLDKAGIFMMNMKGEGVQLKMFLCTLHDDCSEKVPLLSQPRKALETTPLNGTMQ